MRSINGLPGPHRQLGQLASRHAILRGTPARSFTRCASWRTSFVCRARAAGEPAPTHPATSPQATSKTSDLYLCPWLYLRDSLAVTVRSRLRPFLSRTGGGSSVPRAARGPNRSILSGTTSGDRLVPTARSADITWSRGADEVFGSHGCKASASSSATWSRPSRSGRSCVPPGSAPRPARPDLEAGPARPGRRHPRGRFRTRGHRAAPAPPRLIVIEL